MNSAFSVAQMGEKETKEEVWRTIQQMNRLWTSENRPELLKDYFHKDMIAITPSNAERIEGREACVKAWTDFAKAAKVAHWKETDPKILLFAKGKLAVVTYFFDMEFTMGGQKTRMNGRDLFALVKERGRWWIVSDQFSQTP